MSDQVQANQQEQAAKGNFGLGMMLSLGVMSAMLALLVYFGGVWNFLGNTRLLDFFVKAGIIQYHDRTQGLTYIPDVKYYLHSQDAIRWEVIFVVVVMFVLVFALKALQFNGIARLLGLTTNLGQNFRAYCYGLTWNKTAPFGFGNVAGALALADEGVPLKRAKTAVFASTLFDLFEIAAFGFIGLFLLGWSTWVAQLFWAAFITGVALLVIRKTHVESDEDWCIKSWGTRARQTIRLILSQPLSAIWLTVLSLAAFFLQDLAAYFTAMGFSNTNVFLLVKFDVMMMAVVAYHIGRFFKFTPGGIGQGEWAMAAALWIGGVGFPECATIAVLHMAFRLLSAGVFHFFATNAWDGTVKTSLARIAEVFRRGPQAGEPADKDGALVVPDAPTELPVIHLERAPASMTLLRRLSMLGLVFLGLFLLDRVSLVLFDYWLLLELKLASVFWTNFAMSAKLFVIGLVTMTIGIALPAYLNKLDAAQRRLVTMLAVIGGSLGGYFLSGTYLDFLYFDGLPFGEVDPVYGKDLGFYVYNLDNYWHIWRAAIFGTGLGLLSAIGCSYLAWLTAGKPDPLGDVGASRTWRMLSILFNKITLVPVALVGIVLAWGEWLSRYDLLFNYHKKHVVKVGATVIDVDGFLSNRTYVYVTTVVILALAGMLLVYLKTLNEANEGKAAEGWQPKLTQLRNFMLLLLVVDFGFKGAVGLRNVLAVQPNEPVIQLDYIARHVEATRKAYGMANVEEIEFVPAGPGDPVPDVDALINHPTIKNAPLWPGFSSYLEAQLDPQHSLRILQTQGDKMIYGPTMEIFFQQQKLRAYYNFLGIDSVRYTIDGEKKMFTSAVREVPLVEPQPWLAWWGQQYMLYTHGYGLVMADVASATAEGEPNYVASGIPMKTAYDVLNVEHPRIYYGEGSGTMAYTNVKGMKELDYPTNQGRAELWLPEGYGTGVHVDSLIKRLAFGWRSGQLFEVLFSGIIDENTRVHYYRTPLERLEQVAPFLYYDSGSVHAAVVDGEVLWIANALSTSDDYPYSMWGDLGDKSDERMRYPRAHRIVNYVEDSVKATVNAATGHLKFYKMTDDPLISTWAGVYPDLFVDGTKEMPAGVRAQLTYPLQYFHLQFDDIYIYYHMQDPMYFFNMEDMFDDADEVLGPIMSSGSAIRFSTEPQSFLLETGGIIPEAKDKLQYALAMPFTSEKAWGLRAIPMVYQDGDDYGRLIVLSVPKGHYTYSPEQADAAIDQNPIISRDFSWWSRMGSDVIRGHTSTLIVGNEVLYVEPIFIRSEQNRATQMKRVAVVFRGVARMGVTLEEALRFAIADYEAGARGDLPSPDDLSGTDIKPRKL